MTSIRPSPAKTQLPPNSVPFGKYRGQPVFVLLRDKAYVRWVIKQPELMKWLEARHPAIYAEVNKVYSAMWVRYWHGTREDRMTSACMVSDFPITFEARPEHQAELKKQVQSVPNEKLWGREKER
jgi:hypothetical protein